MLGAICLVFVVGGNLSLLRLHRFFIAIPRTVVNHDGDSGTAPDPLV